MIIKKEFDKDKTLEKSEEKFRTIFENLRDTVIFVNKKGRILDISPNVEERFGYKKQEVVGKTFMELGIFTLKDTPKIIRLFKDVFINGKTIPFLELEIKHKKGNKIPVEASTKFIKKDDKIEGVLTTIRDITERKKIENALRESEKKYKTVTDNSPNGIYLLSSDGKFKFANKALIDLSGYSAKEFMEINPFEFVHPDYQDTLKNLTQKAFAGDTSTPPPKSEFKIIRKNKEIRWVHLKPTIIKYKGKPAILGNVIDITERKKIEEVLKKERNILNNIIKLNPYSISMYDSEGHYVLGNQAYLNLFGGIPPPPEYSIFNDPILKKAGFQEQILKLKEGEAIESPIEVWYNPHNIKADLPDKNVCTCGTAFPIVDSDGDVKNIVVMHEDITERKKAEQKIRDNLILIQKQNIQLINLQRKLKAYSRKLERKVKRLEKLKLTQKEKMVFSGLVQFPNLNDQKLAQEIKINRSTVTAIRNRLEQKRFFRVINIPHPNQLDCELIDIATGYFERPLKNIHLKSLIENFKDMAEVFFVDLTERKFIIFSALSDLIAHRRMMNKLEEIFNNLNSNVKPNHIHFPSQITNFDFFFDFNNALDNPPCRIKKPSSAENIVLPKKLNKNQKKIFYLLVKHPGCSIKKLADLSGLTKITASKIMKFLFDQQLLITKVVPNLRKLNCQTIVLHHFSPAEKLIEIRKRLPRKHSPSIILNMSNETDFLELVAYKDNYTKNKYEEFLNYHHNRLDIDHKKMGLLLNEIKYQKLDFAPLVKKSLGF
ncbi:MAG: PAS domain S-box protein [Nanoarchaeota archaeon]|nr:PAS domain S-box protein [Nanoarchaeota archaeon]